MMMRWPIRLMGLANLLAVALAGNVIDERGELSMLVEPTLDMFDGKAYLEIKKSTLGEAAGLGVFVGEQSIPIRKGTILTTYGSRDLAKTLLFDAMEQEPLYTMSIPNKPEHVRVGALWDPKNVPAKVQSDVPVGHLMNDAAKIGPEDLGVPGRDTFVDIVEHYTRQSHARANVNWTVDAISEGTFELIATRRLKPGEELFLNYGPVFWLDDLMKRGPNPFVRLVVYNFLTQAEPQMFDQGYLVYKRGKKPFLSNTQAEPDEAWCKVFMRDFLDFKRVDKAVLKRMGLKSSMTYKEKLYHFLELSFGDPDMEANVDAHKKTKK